jgi:hypothetical protein
MTIKSESEEERRAQQARKEDYENDLKMMADNKARYEKAVKSMSDNELRELLADTNALIEKYYARKGFVTAEDRIRDELKAIEHDDADTLTWRGAHFYMSSKEGAALDLMINKRYAEDELRRRGL